MPTAEETVHPYNRIAAALEKLGSVTPTDGRHPLDRIADVIEVLAGRALARQAKAPAPASAAPTSSSAPASASPQ